MSPLNVRRYRKPPTISPGLIFVRKHFLMGLYTERLIWGIGELIYGLHFPLARWSTRYVCDGERLLCMQEVEHSLGMQEGEQGGAGAAEG